MYRLCCALENFSLKEELAKLKEEHRNEQLIGTESVHDHDGMYIAGMNCVVLFVAQKIVIKLKV